MRSSPTSEQPKRLLQLDGLRGLAACVVGLIFHARYLYDGAVNPLAGVPVVGWFQVWGWSMVDLFFVLSGFVFAHCYLRGWRMRPDTTLAGFAVARIARLWPLHIALLGFAALALRSDPATTWQNVVLSAAMLQIATPNPTMTLNAPAWSLSVEMICYGVFAVAAFLGPRALKLSTALAIAWSAAVVVADGPWDALVGRGLLAFFAGLLLRQTKALTDRIPTAPLVSMVAIPVILPPDGPWLILTVLISWPALLLVALRTQLLAATPFVWLGDRSYAIYLSHIPIYTVIGSLALRADIESRSSWLILTAITWTLVLVVSNTLYRKVERPAQRAILAWHKVPSGRLARFSRHASRR